MENKDFVLEPQPNGTFYLYRNGELIRIFNDPAAAVAGTNEECKRYYGEEDAA